MEIIPDKRKVVGLVEQAREGKICLPNFQRDFVWTREEVADLVRSIVRNYFIVDNAGISKDAHVLYAHLGGQPAINAYSALYH